MMGGHMIVLVLTLLIFIFGAMGYAVASGTAVISVLFSVFMLLIDVLVSFIQAYVFTMLSTIFISLAQEIRMRSIMPNPQSDNYLNLINLSELSERVNIK